MKSNFLEYYNKSICPKIRSIDIAIKSHEQNLDIKYISSLLDLSESEIVYILKQKHITAISSEDIITIMLNGSSYICKIFRKTLNIGCPKFYTAEELSYTYLIDYKKVKGIYENLNIDKVTANDFPIIFEKLAKQ